MKLAKFGALLAFAVLASGASGKTRMYWPGAPGTSGGGGPASVDWSFVDAGFGWFHLSDGGATLKADKVQATGSWDYLLTYDGGILLADGGGIGPTRQSKFECWNQVNGMPCVSNPTGIVEIYGHVPPGHTTNTVCAVELYNESVTSSTGCSFGIGNGNTSTKWFYMMANGQMHFTDDIIFETSANMIKQTASNQYIEMQANAATNATAIWITNTSTPMTSAGAWMRWGVGDYARVLGDGTFQTESSRNKGCDVLTGGTKTVTVASGATCVVSQKTTVGNAVKGSVTTTTLTITDTSGSSTDNVCWICL